jgi:type III pantothenate kinase
LSILLIDIGNTRVKWARLSGTRVGPARAGTHAQWSVQHYAREILQPAAAIERIVVASVADARVADALNTAARRVGAPSPEFVKSARRAGGVVTAYTEPWRLGVDRFVSALGAHHIAGTTPVCVVSVGTALTIDLVDGKGRHRGGCIVPGPSLMVESLLTSTSGIRRRARGGTDGGRGLFARTTRTAIGQGSRYAAAAVVDRAVEEAKALLGRKPLVLISGGAAPQIKPLLRTRARAVPDLVLIGLAVWAGVSPRE